MVDPKETRFKAMSWDEKETILGTISSRGPSGPEKKG
jgi:hypothetical protein